MKHKRELHIDIETYCEVDLKTCGLYRYVEDDSLLILLFAYAFDDGEVEVLDLAKGDKIPPFLIDALTDETIIKVAHNAQFERTVLNKALCLNSKPEQWRCTMVRALSLGLPAKLETVGKALKLDDDKLKLSGGKLLINYFSKPCKPTASNGYRTRNLPHHNLEKWNQFIEYNKRDVETERVIDNILKQYPETPELEHKLWCLDQKINAQGVLVDTKLINNIIDYATEYKNKLIKTAKKISGLENPNSIKQIKNWLEIYDIKTNSLDKKAVAKILDEVENNSDVTAFLKVRQELSKTSVKKYIAMDRSVCKDNRIRGMLQFYGANRTGRWAGRIVQLQNLPANKLKDLYLARELVVDQDFEFLEMLYPSIMDVFSQLIRTSFIAKPKHTLVVADYSAIEARVLSWLANEKWRMEVFASHGKIYEAAASKMFRIPLEKITKTSPYRVRGKVAELACGYGGAVGALRNIKGTEDMTDDELEQIVDAWRAQNPNIVNFWYQTEKAVIEAITSPGNTIHLNRDITIKMIKDSLFIYLPSGRPIVYKNAHVGKICNRQEVRYYGLDSTNRWVAQSTYGGKLVENITQAIARDCLAMALLKLNNNGYLPLFHVHDEIVVEVPKKNADDHMNKIVELMKIDDLTWTKGMLLQADAFITDYYQKD